MSDFRHLAQKGEQIFEMEKILKILKGIIEVFNIIAVVALVSMLLLVCCNVFMRYFFKNPIPGTYEMTQMLMICLSPCIAVNILSKECVWVDVLTSRLERLGQMVIDIITLPLSTLIIGIMAWQGYNMIWTSIEKNTYSPIMTFRLYEWPFRLIYFLAMTMAAVAALCFTIERFLAYRHGGTPSDRNEVDRAKESVGDLSVGANNTEGGNDP